MQPETTDKLEESLQKEIPCEALKGCNEPGSWIHILLKGVTFMITRKNRQILCETHKEMSVLRMKIHYGDQFDMYNKYIKL